MAIVELNEKSLPDSCYVYKHSTTCPVSAAAAEQVRQLEVSLPIYWINVIEQRPISNWVEEQYSVRHESPQLLLLKTGSVEQVWSHRQVKKEEIEKSEI